MVSPEPQDLWQRHLMTGQILRQAVEVCGAEASKTVQRTWWTLAIVWGRYMCSLIALKFNND